MEALHAGAQVCGGGKKKYARVYRLCCEALEDTPADHLIWMPAHLAKSKVGLARLSNGRLMTELDRSANDSADKKAKTAVEIHRVDPEEVEGWRQAYGKAVANAKWMARATHEASNQYVLPFQDSESARWKSDEAAAQRRRPKNQRSNNCGVVLDKLKVWKARRTPEKGGHTPEKVQRNGKRSGWRCRICRAKSSSYGRLAVGKCEGEVLLKWMQKPQEMEVNADAGAGWRNDLSQAAPFMGTGRPDDGPESKRQRTKATAREAKNISSDAENDSSDRDAMVVTGLGSQSAIAGPSEQQGESEGAGKAVPTIRASTGSQPRRSRLVEALAQGRCGSEDPSNKKRRVEGVDG